MVRFPCMSYRPPNEMVVRWRAELDALLLSRQQEAVEVLTKEMEAERREALEDFDQRWSDHASSNNGFSPSHQTAAQVTSMPPRGGDVPPKDSSSEALTGVQKSGPRPVRQMVMEVLPEFQDGEFEQGNVREKILARWPDVDDTYLASRVSKLLKEMSDKGTLSRRKEVENRWSAFLYRIEHDREGQLLKP